MDIDVKISDLKTALTIANKAIGKSNCLPALSGVRLTAIGESLGLVASNLDVTVLQTIGATVRTPGQVLVPAKLLAGTVKKGGKGNIGLVASTDGIEVVNGARTNLRTLPLDEFLRFSGPAEDIESFPLDLDAVAEVMTAACKDEARPILTGVLFGGGEHGTELVATDSYRLHLRRGHIVYPKALVPARALAQVVAAKPKGNVTIQFGQDSVYITAGSTTWIIRLIEGEFPNYRQLIPANNTYEVEVDRVGFISLITAVAPMARQAVPVRLHFGAEKLTVTAITHDVGEAAGSMESFSHCHMPDDGLTVAFNPEFLLDTAKVGTGDRLTISFMDALKPSLISDERGAAVSTRLLMPVRVS